MLKSTSSFLLPCDHNLKLHLLNNINPNHCVSVIRNDTQPLLIINASDQILVIDILKESLIWCLNNAEIILKRRVVKIDNSKQKNYAYEKLVGDGMNENEAFHQSSVAGMNHPDQIKQLMFTDKAFLESITPNIEFQRKESDNCSVSMFSMVSEKQSMFEKQSNVPF
jgi:hypothetical protein